MEAVAVAAAVSETTRCTIANCWTRLITCCRGGGGAVDETDAEYHVNSVQYHSNCCSTTTTDEDRHFQYQPTLRDSKNFKSGNTNSKSSRQFVCKESSL